MKIFAQIMLLLIGILSIIGPFWWRSTNNPTQKPLVIGMMGGWAPFMSLDSNGNYQGFDVDVAKALGKELKREVLIKDLGSLPALILALRQGLIDMGMSGLDIIKEREEQFDMVRYTGLNTTELKLIVTKETARTIKSLDDFKGKPDNIISYEPGSSQEQFITTVANITTKTLPSVQEMILDVRYGRSTGALVEPSVTATILNQNPDMTSIVVPLPKDFHIKGMGIMLTKNNRLSDSVRKALARLEQEGSLAAIQTTWKVV